MDLFRRLFTKSDDTSDKASQSKSQQNTVFISYRREVSSYIARAVFMDLRAHGYDVFMDVENINAGEFGKIIPHQIAARAHFIVILAPGSVERCSSPDDWLRREIEMAIEQHRNIIPLMCDHFTFAQNEGYLTGQLAQLSRYNGLNLHHDYFDEAMNKLRTRFLVLPIEVSISPVSTVEQKVVETKIEEVASQPTPTKNELKAEELFRLGYGKQQNEDFSGAIAHYDEAVALNPQYTKAYYNRGLVHYYQKKLDQAIANYDKAIELRPDYAKAFNNRGLARFEKGSAEEALPDYNEALRLNPAYTIVYNNRGNARAASQNFDGAIADYEKYLSLGGGAAYGNQYDVEKILYDLKALRDSGGEKKISAGTLKRFTKLTTGMLPPMPQVAQSIVDGETLFQPSDPAKDAAFSAEVANGLSKWFGIAEGATRPLAPEDILRSRSESQLFGQATHGGVGGFINQDAVFSMQIKPRSAEERPDFGLFVAADGMGKGDDGEKAAVLVVQTLEWEILNTVYLALIRQDTDRPPLTEALEAAVQKADARMSAEVSEGSCVVTAAVVLGDLAYIAHVGDSRAYLMNQDSIEQLTRDHTLVQRLIELDQLTPEQAKNHPQRNVLYRALGLTPLGHNEMLQVDTFTRRLPSGSWLLLCTDGLTTCVEDNEIADFVKHSQSPQEACDRLVALANTRGGPDNISVILVSNPQSDVMLEAVARKDPAFLPEDE